MLDIHGGMNAIVFPMDESYSILEDKNRVYM